LPFPLSNSSSSAPAYVVAIIGGGCAGTLVASQLLRQAWGPARILVIERGAAIGRGVAYGTDFNEHRLNVPAARMSALPEDPKHFLNWARERVKHLGFPDTVDGNDFLPRWMYGRYLEFVLEESKGLAPPDVVLEIVHGEAVDLAETPAGKTITLADGRILVVSAVVLALGLLPGEYPIRRPLPVYHSPRYLHSPLLPTALSGVEKQDDILIVGAGLTAVDIILQCRLLGHRGVIHALSRRGIKPVAHSASPAEPYPAFLRADALPVTVHAAMTLIRAELASAAARGIDWRPVLDSIRPVSAALWEGFSWAERARFLRHVRPFWEAHRHRIAPATAAIIASVQQEGRLKFHAGRLISLRESAGRVAAVLKVRGEERFEALSVAKVINCTGPRSDYSKYQHPLLVNLLAAGLIGHDPLALGIDALPTGQVLRYGTRTPVAGLFTLGATLKGVLWESTAVPEIRVQARQLAEYLCSESS